MNSFVLDLLSKLFLILMCYLKIHHLPPKYYSSVGGIRARGQATGPRVKQLIAIYHTRLLAPKDQNFKQNLAGKKGFHLSSGVKTLRLA